MDQTSTAVHVSQQASASVAFLGVCERAGYVRDGNTNLFKWNVLGLKHVVLSFIYPLNLQGLSIGLAFLRSDPPKPIALTITGETGNHVGYITFSAVAAADDEKDPALKSTGPILTMPQQGWNTAFLPIHDGNLVIPEPGAYLISAETDRGQVVVGQLLFLLVDPEPFSPERVAAIKSDPRAVKAVRVQNGCRKCSSQLLVYAALERLPKMEEEGYIWYESVPEEFRCECGSTRTDLSIIRKNLFGLIGQHPGMPETLDYFPLYERGAIESLHRNFAELLKRGPAEEVLQQFFQENPILLHRFPADRIFFKPPLLTFYHADIAILTPSKELILIELETTGTRLLKKDGGVAAPLQHAFDQVESWLHVVDEHRLAVLDSLKIDRTLVSSIRGVVIAGRDEGYDAEQLRRHKGVDRGRVTFWTYDDVLSALAVLARRLREF